MEEKKNSAKPTLNLFCSSNPVCPKQATEPPAWPRDLSEPGRSEGSVKGRRNFREALVTTSKWRPAGAREVQSAAPEPERVTHAAEEDGARLAQLLLRPLQG